MRRAPFPPLVPGSDTLRERPLSLEPLRQRMAAIYGVSLENLLVVADVAAAMDLAARRGEVHLIASPGTGSVLDRSEATRCAQKSQFLVIDESLIEFTDKPSLASLAVERSNIAVLRSLSFAYGLAGAPCGALIANADLVAALAALATPAPLATPVIKLALAALDPSRLALTLERWRIVRAERLRVVQALAQAGGEARAEDGPYVVAAFRDAAAVQAAITAFALDAEALDAQAFRFAIGAPEDNDVMLAALGAGAAAQAPRRATIVRDTKETRIVVQVDLDRAGEPRADTGLGFFDHMLTQIAFHGGFALDLACSGDLHIDAHHSVEDCAIALGQALDQALGERRGVGRFGFVLPMDETEAQVSIDLGGRPFSVFNGTFSATHIGAYPTEMTAHVFRSLAENLRASVHLTVAGENDHHKTEACFKAFGRALREAIRVHGSTVPSTKGAL